MINPEEWTHLERAAADYFRDRGFKVVRCGLGVDPNAHRHDGDMLLIDNLTGKIVAEIDAKRLDLGWPRTILELDSIKRGAEKENFFFVSVLDNETVFGIFSAQTASENWDRDWGIRTESHGSRRGSGDPFVGLNHKYITPIEEWEEVIGYHVEANE